MRFKRAFTLVELLVATVIGLLVVGAAYFIYNFFFKMTTEERTKLKTIQEVRLALSVLEDDIKHASFGYPKTPPSPSPCHDKSICVFALEDNCTYGKETFCKTGEDRLFIGNGWQIIRDFAEPIDPKTNQGPPDGFISNAKYEVIAGKHFYAKVHSYVKGEKKVTVDKVDLDGNGEKDFRSGEAIIICGRKRGADSGQEGRRISKVSDNTLKFNTTELPLYYDENCGTDKGYVIPAVAWYVRKQSGIYWLYRNNDAVLPNVESFQVKVGYDKNGDGIIDANEILDAIPPNAVPSRLKFFEIKLKVAYYANNKKNVLTYLTKVKAFH